MVIQINITLVTLYRVLYFPVGKLVVSGVFHSRYIIDGCILLSDQEGLEERKRKKPKLSHTAWQSFKIPLQNSGMINDKKFEH